MSALGVEHGAAAPVVESVGATIAANRAAGRGTLLGYLPIGFPDLATSIDAAVALVENVKARDAGLQVRAGLGYGEVLAISGDYFGNPVNLAARLTTNAEPGQILSSSALRDALPEHDFAPARSFTLKGFDAPVTAYPLQSLIG